jgi:hypothetical protein
LAGAETLSFDASSTSISSFGTVVVAAEPVRFDCLVGERFAFGFGAGSDAGELSSVPRLDNTSSSPDTAVKGRGKLAPIISEMFHNSKPSGVGFFSD